MITIQQAILHIICLQMNYKTNKRDRLLHEADLKHLLITDKHTETSDCMYSIQCTQPNKLRDGQMLPSALSPRYGVNKDSILLVNKA